MKDPKAKKSVSAGAVKRPLFMIPGAQNGFWLGGPGEHQERCEAAWLGQDERERGRFTAEHARRRMLSFLTQQKDVFFACFALSAVKDSGSFLQ